MSVRLAARRLAMSAPQPYHPSAAAAAARPMLAAAPAQRRHRWFLSGDSKRPPARSRVGTELDDPDKRRQFLERHRQGSLEDSIFQDEIEAGATEERRVRADRRPRPDPGDPAPPPAEDFTREALAAVTDPDPRGRVRWYRRKVIQLVRAGGPARPLTREERIRAEERQLLHRSDFLPTSVKKLVMLARQIAGRPVDEAIAQMKWSKKKMAAEIGYYLEEARDLAVAQRGMGLGRHAAVPPLNPPRRIRTREGRWIDVSDPTRIYIAQSWVGRGPLRGKAYDYKGRGRMGIICRPSTSFSVLLKEEKSRLREYDEAQAKKAAKGPWVHLPDRSIHGQRPYYTW